eukprot:COSAG02_NODE_4095_length_5788_cov_3.722271_6_plen_95_part_00
MGRGAARPLWCTLSAPAICAPVAEPAVRALCPSIQLHRPQVLNSRVAKVVSTTMWFWIMYRGYHDLPHMIVRTHASASISDAQGVRLPARLQAL